MYTQLIKIGRGKVLSRVEYHSEDDYLVIDSITSVEGGKQLELDMSSEAYIWEITEQLFPGHDDEVQESNYDFAINNYLCGAET